MKDEDGEGEINNFFISSVAKGIYKNCLVVHRHKKLFKGF